MFLIPLFLCVTAIQAMENPFSLQASNTQTIEQNIQEHIDHHDVSALKKLHTTLQKLPESQQKSILESINFKRLKVHSMCKEIDDLNRRIKKGQYFFTASTMSYLLGAGWNCAENQDNPLCLSIAYTNCAFIIGLSAYVSWESWNSYQSYQIRKILDKLSQTHKQSV